VAYKKPPRKNYLNTQSSIISFLLSHLRLGGFAAGGEYLGSRVAAGFGPFVVLLGEHGTGEADASAATTQVCWARSEAGPDCSRMVQTSVDTRGYANLGTRASSATDAGTRCSARVLPPGNPAKFHSAALAESAALALLTRSCVKHAK
jgi:hypothetical protein